VGPTSSYGERCQLYTGYYYYYYYFRVKGKKLYFGFVDLEKAFDRVPREVISSAMRKLGVEEWLVSAVMSMYTGAKSFVRTVCGNSEGFEVKVMPTSTKPQAGKLG